MKDVQYCVVLREGENKELKHWVWVSRECVEEVFDTFFAYNPNLEHYRDGWCGGPLRLDSGAEAEFMGFKKGFGKGKRIGSLEIVTKDESSANQLAKDFRLPLPFPNYKTFTSDI